IHSAYVHRVKKLLFLGSSCIYPKFADQPIREDSLLGGKLEPTNEAYAIAKIAGVKMCEFYNRQYHTNFISAMPTNLFGAGDNYSAMAKIIKEVVGYSGLLVFDSTKPDGTPRKLLDSSRLRALGWKPKISLRQGIEATYKDFLSGNVRM
ncbi:MAG: NAD-dependent epimerase/dehydratase family protein, partial [Leptospira sp.]|nr:NAD-dependent epimerase/dehydratase family protein [Leptospira sp.]